MIAILCASYLLAPLIDPPNHRWIHAILLVCMIASVPFAFIVSLIRQQFTSPRMWTSFLFTLLVSSWLGFLSPVTTVEMVQLVEPAGSRLRLRPHVDGKLAEAARNQHGVGTYET